MEPVTSFITKVSSTQRPVGVHRQQVKKINYLGPGAETSGRIKQKQQSKSDDK